MTVPKVVNNQCLLHYSGIIVSVAMFGPALSYGLGSVFSNLYVTLQGTTYIL